METWYMSFLHVCQLSPLLALGKWGINDQGYAMEKAISLYIIIFGFEPFCSHSWGLLCGHGGGGREDEKKCNRIKVKY